MPTSKTTSIPKVRSQSRTRKTKAMSSPSKKPLLHYWKSRGRAEIIRLTMAAAGVEWDDAPYMDQPEDIEKLRDSGKLVFNQLPLLQIDGINMVQTYAVVRYVSAKHGLNGKNAEEQYRIDMLSEGLRDFAQPIGAYKFMPDEAFKASVTQAVDRYMPIFQKVLTDNGTNHLVGDRLTMVDIQLLEILLSLNDLQPVLLDKYPKMKEYQEKISAIPSLAAYLKSEKRFPPNDDDIIASIKRVLKF
uniref:Glutathione transferase n=1 Tax=Plectus sambesii TaxID=2011161 RepID=A0A914UUT8_9BILA